MSAWPRVRYWFRRRRAEREASWELCANGVHAACNAMHALNRYAKVAGDERRWEVYRLKRILITELREQYACHVTAVTQRLDCWRCYGTGVWTSESGHYQDSCWKCGGSGVHREQPLYLFAFTIEGRRYAWHQPRENWPHVIPHEFDEIPYKAPAKHGAWLDELPYETHAETVAQWIDSQGFELKLRSRKADPPFTAALVGDLHALHRNLPRWLMQQARWKWRALKRRIDALRGMEEGYDLPF